MTMANTIFVIPNWRRSASSRVVDGGRKSCEPCLELNASLKSNTSPGYADWTCQNHNHLGRLLERKGIGPRKYNYGEGIYIGIRLSGSKTRLQRTITLDVSVIKNRSIAHEMNLELQPMAWPTDVHTFSHLIIKELCQASGYSLGSITERLYLETDEQHVQKAGILLYHWIFF